MINAHYMTSRSSSFPDNWLFVMNYSGKMNAIWEKLKYDYQLISYCCLIFVICLTWNYSPFHVDKILGKHSWLDNAIDRQIDTFTIISMTTVKRTSIGGTLPWIQYVHLHCFINLSKQSSVSNTVKIGQRNF